MRECIKLKGVREGESDGVVAMCCAEERHMADVSASENPPCKRDAIH